MPLLVIENDRATGSPPEGSAASRRIAGNAADPGGARPPPICRPRVACSSPSPTPSKAVRSVEQARKANPALPIIARAHSEEEIEHLKKHGASVVIMGEHEIAKAMIDGRAGSANGLPAAPHCAATICGCRLSRSCTFLCGAEIGETHERTRRHQYRHSAGRACWCWPASCRACRAALRRAAAADLPRRRHAGRRIRARRHPVSTTIRLTYHGRFDRAGADPVRRRSAHPLCDLSQRAGAGRHARDRGRAADRRADRAGCGLSPRPDLDRGALLVGAVVASTDAAAVFFLMHSARPAAAAARRSHHRGRVRHQRSVRDLPDHRAGRDPAARRQKPALRIALVLLRSRR